MSEIDHVDILEKNLARQIEAVRASDTKIALLIPAETIMLGVIAAMFRVAEPGPLTSLYVAFSTVPLILSYASAALSAFPRLRSSAGSLLFFGSIAARSPDNYLAAIRALDGEAYVADLAEQCGTVARIAAAKYGHARNAYLTFNAALPFWAFAVYLLSRAA
jgi:hypothetical protein